MWVGECFFWYQLTRVVPDKFHRAVKRLCVCSCYDFTWPCAGSGATLLFASFVFSLLSSYLSYLLPSRIGLLHFQVPVPGEPVPEPIWIVRKQVAVASAGPYANLHVAQPRLHPTTKFFTGRMPFLPHNRRKSWYSFFHPMKGSRISQPRHCTGWWINTTAQPVVGFNPAITQSGMIPVITVTNDVYSATSGEWSVVMSMSISGFVYLRKPYRPIQTLQNFLCMFATATVAWSFSGGIMIWYDTIVDCL